jgi:transcriptional regulator with XRE-family HTH domain
MESHDGALLAEIRKELKLSQAELAASAGLSQATISRLENSEEWGSDIRVLSKIAKAVNRPLSDFLPQTPAYPGNEHFFALCPNPLCSRNRHSVNEKGPAVYWQSWSSYPSTEFADVNFCPSCGTELVKECPNCKRRFPAKESRYCIRCGERICKRPTSDEWKAIEEIHTQSTPTPEGVGNENPDIPF